MIKLPTKIVWLAVFLGLAAGLLASGQTRAVDATRGLIIRHGVLNVSRGDTIFVSHVNAYEGETVRFEVEITTTGSAAQTGVIVRESLSSRISYLSGDILAGSGLVVGNLQPNETRIYTFEAVALGSVIGTVTNTARVESHEVSEKSAPVTVTISKVPDPVRGLEIITRVLNVSENESTFRSSTTASDGDRVRFEIRITATGDADQTDVTVRDVLPSRLTYLSGYNLSSPGYNLGEMNAGESITLDFDARVDSSISTTIINTARVESEEVNSRSASATVRVMEGDNGDLDLSIDKRVRNITRGETNFLQNTNASVGDLVRFEIEIEALGDDNQTGVLLRDVLPVGLTFESGDRVPGTGVNIGAMADGQRRTYIFDARVIGAGTGSLTNTAYVQSNQVSERSDKASVNMSGAVVAAVSQRKTAFNLTQNANAASVTARSGDVITYALYFKNTGSSVITGKVIEDDISDVLELAEIVDQGGAASVDHVIRWAPMAVAAGSEIARSFQVRVRASSLFPANSDLVMSNFYGNEVRVTVAREQVAGVVTTPPRTGASENTVLALAALSTLGYWIYRRTRKATARIV